MNSLSNCNVGINVGGSSPNWLPGLRINSNDVSANSVGCRIRTRADKILTPPINTTGTVDKRAFEKRRLKVEPTDMDVFPLREIELSESEIEELDRLSRETRENGVSWESLKAKLGL